MVRIYLRVHSLVLQAKVNLLQNWVRDIEEQNVMLVRVVEELEVEAAERVIMLEEKLKTTSKCACEVCEFSFTCPCYCNVFLKCCLEICLL